MPRTEGTKTQAIRYLLELCPMTLREANDFVQNFHRHNGRTSRDGGKFAVGCTFGRMDCSVCGFIKNRHNMDRPCPGAVKVALRDTDHDGYFAGPGLFQKARRAGDPAS